MKCGDKKREGGVFSNYQILKFNSLIINYINSYFRQ